MSKEEILNALRMALEKNRWIIGETNITLLPTELVIEIYNSLSDNEKLSL